MSATTIRISQVYGEAVLDSDAMALLFGVASERIRSHTQQRGGGAVEFPKAWVQQGRRRAREAAAHTSSKALLDIMSYWALKDHGAELEVVYQ